MLANAFALRFPSLYSQRLLLAALLLLSCGPPPLVRSTAVVRTAGSRTTPATSQLTPDEKVDVVVFRTDWPPMNPERQAIADYIERTGSMDGLNAKQMATLKVWSNMTLLKLDLEISEEAQGKRNLAKAKALAQNVMAVAKKNNYQILIEESTERLMFVYLDMMDYARAEQLELKYLKMVRRHGDNSVEVTISHINLGHIYHLQGRYIEALESSHAALKILASQSKPDIYLLAMALSNGGEALLGAEEPAKALKISTQAAQVALTEFDKNDLILAMPYSVMGQAYRALGQWEKATELHTTALLILRRSTDSEPMDTASAHHELGQTHQAAGNLGGALVAYKKALEIRSKVFGARDPRTREVQRNIDEVLLQIR